ncbi:MAG: acyltransferase family protein [Acidimicrobiia bacterium]
MSELPPPVGGTLLQRDPVPPPSVPGAGWRHVASLDGLRGVAVLAVLLFHADLLTGGFLGVDLFFTLSGFLITSLLLTEARRTDRVDLIAFWGRRFRRLLPAILVLLAVVVVVTWLIGTPAQLDAVHRAGLPALGYVANWHQIAQEGGYWASFAEPSPMTHLWSLAIEEQFYVVWPFVFFGLWKLTRGSERAIAAVAGLGALGSAVLMAVLYTGGDPTRVYMGTDTRAFSILFGVAVAAAPIRATAARMLEQHRVVVQVGLVAIVFAGALVWSSVDGASSTILFEGGLAVHAALSAVLIVCCAADDRLLAARLFSGRLLGYVGTRSYGLYLWHWPVYVALDEDRTELDGWLLFAVRVAVSFALAEVSYRVVESPIRHRARWARGRSGAVAMAAGLAAVALVYVVVPEASAEIARFDPSALTPTTVPAEPTPTTTLAASATPTSSPAETSVVSGSTAPASTAAATTTTIPPPKPLLTSVLWMGDSVAWDAGPGVEAALTAAGLQVETAAYVGTGVVPNRGVDPLQLFLGRLVTTPRDLAIFQLSGWDLDFPEAEQRRAIRAFRDQVRADGARMMFLLPPTVDPDRYHPDFTILLDEVRLLVEEDPDGTILLDSQALWGQGYARDMNGDGIPERKLDGVHVCPSGAALLGQWLTLQLAERFDGVTPADPVLWAGLSWVTDPRYNQPLGVCS